MGSANENMPVHLGGRRIEEEGEESDAAPEDDSVALDTDANDDDRSWTTRTLPSLDDVESMWLHGLNTTRSTGPRWAFSAAPATVKVGDVASCTWIAPLARPNATHWVGRRVEGGGHTAAHSTGAGSTREKVDSGDADGDGDGDVDEEEELLSEGSMCTVTVD